MRLFTLLLLLIASPALALNEGLQCVPYARAVSGIEIRGDAHTWWAQAEGQYSRGNRPRVGAVMSFKSHGVMRLGHIATVRHIVDNRNVLVSHANWSTIGGQRGHIEENVRVLDVSQDNDWSEVQVWYTPNAALGTTRYPLNGFIYPASQRSEKDVSYAVSQLLGRPATVMAAASVRPDARANVKTAASIPAATFQLSYSTLSEVNRKSKNERTAVTPRVLTSSGTVIAKNKRAAIDDLLETLPSPLSVLR